MQRLDDAFASLTMTVKNEKEDLDVRSQAAHAIATPPCLPARIDVANAEEMAAARKWVEAWVQREEQRRPARFQAQSLLEQIARDPSAPPHLRQNAMDWYFWTYPHAAMGMLERAMKEAGLPPDFQVWLKKQHTWLKERLKNRQWEDAMASS